MDAPETPAPKRQPRRVVIAPMQYRIGRDLTQDEYNTLVIKVAEWFSERKSTLKEPVKLAKRYIDCCLKGTKPKDPEKPWVGAEQWSLALRIKSACAYDMEKMVPLYNKLDRKRMKSDQTKARAKRELAKKQVDPLTPEAVRVLGRKEATYGDDPTVFLSRKEHERWLALKAQYVEQFPELGYVNAEAELNVLCDLLILSERHRLRMLNGEKLETRDYQQLISSIDSIKTTLGIHPNQLAKRVQDRRSGSFAELLARYETMDDAREIRERHWIEELIQLYQMYHQPSPRPDQGGYQLDEVGLLGLTGCRTCKCAGCGVQNYAGLDITEVERYLEVKNVLVVESEPSLSVETEMPRTPDEVEAYAADPHPDVQEVWDAQFRATLRETGMDRPDREAPE